jgi:hypothetical protein
MDRIAQLFENFLNDTTNRDDIKYSLTHSTVEPIICFKFGSWLSMKNISNINILELNNVDLPIGIGNDLFFIESGHLLNLLKHDTSFSKRKVVSDCEKLPKKIKSFCDPFIQTNLVILVIGKQLSFIMKFRSGGDFRNAITECPNK